MHISMAARDEFRMVLGGQATPRPFFFYNKICENPFFPLLVINDKKLVAKHVQRGGKEIRFNLFGAPHSKLFVSISNIWLPLTMGRNKNGVGWPPNTMRNLSIIQISEK